MFPGCTLWDLCARQQELLQDGGYLPGQVERDGTPPRDRVAQWRGLLINLALSIVLSEKMLWWLR